MGKRLQGVLAFIVIAFFYSAWMTGLTFTFSEIRIWPNFNMLAEAFAKGQVYLDKSAAIEDFSVVNGKVYLYSGPVPALLRIPALILLGSAIPTGFMIVLFCAGVTFLLCLVTSRLGSHNSGIAEKTIRTIFSLVIVLNGYTLFLVTIPSFHHESIASAMFFLTAALYLVLRMRAHESDPSLTTSGLLGLSFALCLGSRLTYAPAVIFLAIVAGIPMLRSFRRAVHLRIVLNVAAIFGTLIVAAFLLALYNYVRYGAWLDTGMQYQASIVFGEYFRAGNYFRYDHIPLNIWSYFFRIPELLPGFPYIGLPAYTVIINSVQLMPYRLIYHNELSVSAFFLMPVLVLMLLPLALRAARPRDAFDDTYRLFLTVFALLVLPLSLTVASTARYYFDFVPIMTLMAYLAATQLVRMTTLALPFTALLAILSLALSWSLPISGVLFYRALINYVSPLMVFIAPFLD